MYSGVRIGEPTKVLIDSRSSSDCVLRSTTSAVAIGGGGELNWTRACWGWLIHRCTPLTLLDITCPSCSLGPALSMQL